MASLLLTPRHQFSLEPKYSTKDLKLQKPRKKTSTMLSTIKDCKLTRKDIKRGLQIFRRHAIDKPQLLQSLPRVSIDEYYDIETCMTQAGIDKLMKKEKKWVMRHGDEKMKTDFPAVGEKVDKKAGWKEKFVRRVCERAKMEVKSVRERNKLRIF